MARIAPPITPTDVSAYLRAALKAARRDDRSGAATSPRYGERIWVPLERCQHQSLARLSPRQSGLVLPGDWDQQVQPLTDNPKIAYCLRHWRDGQTWEEAGAVDYMMEKIAANVVHDHLTTRGQVLRRFAELDRIFEQVRAEGCLRPMKQARWLVFREYGGPLFHIGSTGQPIFGPAGHHRLGMALALGHKTMPAQLGVIHPAALSTLPALRTRPA
ncbi:hypothetical protein SAMN04490244_11089 [Tranquillimonas rosea]|uniref:Uncharacterized protein n=1 Tax=Tranquillimonas rosea TaxID=641238 RepID=A0A1H9WDM6_9RHOB|nr:hypothetical protein [Tranquillimonas rosea]SES31889.1 hypothetical protein SAMN04490244_11089 [Tranquillimonas rosea]